MGNFNSQESLQLAPYVGQRNTEAEKSLRLKRWKARAWMRENNILTVDRRTEWKPAPVT